MVKDNRKELVENLRRLIQSVAQADCDGPPIIGIRHSEPSIPVEIWDAIFDCNDYGVKFKAIPPIRHEAGGCFLFFIIFYLDEKDVAGYEKTIKRTIEKILNGGFDELK